jgi:PadR family transcriptional regulator, regulatory protein AphA
MTQRTMTPTRPLTLTERAVLAVLGLVDRPISGYDLRKLIETSVGYLWRPSKTQLYAVLPRLVAERLATSRSIEQQDRPDKQVYRITAAGRAVTRKWLDEADDEADPDRSTFVLKLFFGGQADRDSIIPQVRVFRDAYAERLAVYEAKRSTDPVEHLASDQFTRITLRYGIARARAAVEWADAAIEELER